MIPRHGVNEELRKNVSTHSLGMAVTDRIELTLESGVQPRQRQGMCASNMTQSFFELPRSEYLLGRLIILIQLQRQPCNSLHHSSALASAGGRGLGRFSHDLKYYFPQIQ